MSFLYILVGVVALYVFTVGWFLALAKAVELNDSGVELHDWYIRYPAYVFLATGVLADVLFNVIFGSIIFREIPKEFLFTNRVKRHLKEKSVVAQEWADRLNKIYPGHV